MVDVSIDNLGSIGIIEDLSPHIMPPEAWTSGQNIRFFDNRVEKMLGTIEVNATPNVAPIWALAVLTPTAYFWLYASTAKISNYNGAAHTDITRAVGGDYTANLDFNWNGGILGGIAVMNNGVDIPQFWSTPGSTVKMQDLTAWPSGYVCKIIVPFKQHLIALNMTQGGVNYPHRILWSDLADPGSVPASWDIADPTKDAGETELSDVGSGGIQAGLVLGNALIIYKENSIWFMQTRADEFIFSFNTLFKNIGTINSRSVVVIPKQKKHIFFSGDDLLVHDGQEMFSVLTSKQRKNLVAKIDTTTYIRSYLAVNRSKQEIWLCYPETGQTYPNMVLAYNYENNTITERALTPAAHIAIGFADSTSGASGTWDSDSETWDSDLETWNESPTNPALQGLMILDTVNTKFLKADEGNTFDGTLMNSFVERAGLAIIGQDRKGNPIVDVKRRKILSRIWLKMTGGPVTIKALMQEDVGGVITYSSGMSFDPAVDKYVDLDQPLSGRLMGIRVESSTDIHWTLDGYLMEIEVLGSF